MAIVRPIILALPMHPVCIKFALYILVFRRRFAIIFLYILSCLFNSKTNISIPSGGPHVVDIAEKRFALRMVNIEKYFGQVCALKNINFDVERNEIVGLIGDNGAGKSTMVKILTGVFPPTRGEIFIAGRKLDLRSYNVRQAHAHGIETVYQDKSLGEKQVLWRNFFIGREITLPFGFINVRKEKEIASQIMVNTIGFRGKGITVESRVNKLSGGERQGVAIGRAMHFEAELIILDEPTVALSLKEVAKVLNFVQKIKEAGKACIYISHAMADVYEISDRFVIMDRGEIVADIAKKDISLKALDEFLLEYSYGKKDKVGQ
jgi:simple sugar transport system ATP-binding protein